MARISERIEILYADNHLLAVNKPSGIPTQPSQHHKDSLESRAKAWVKATANKPGNVFLHAVHRLDRPVSGVVLFARTSKALSRLNRAIRDHRTSKTYWAITEAVPPCKQNTLTHHLVHDSFHARVVAAETPGSRKAILTYRQLATHGSLALLEVELLTGRYHQIRVQLADIGCVIVGDRKYGSRIESDGSAIALHHRSLKMPHPVGGAVLEIEASLPDRSPWNDFPPGSWTVQLRGSAPNSAT